MYINYTIFFNLFVPLIAGLFFLLYFIYFILANPSHAPSYRFFIIFLIGFSIFIMGRTLQVIIGPYPLPLVIVNVRMFILCSVVAPVVMLTDNIFTRKKIRRRQIVLIGTCALLGLTYVVFNTLGTRGSSILYSENGLTIFDNLTPSMLPPYYSREVTLAVQACIGIMLVLFSLKKLIQLKLGNSLRYFLSDKNFLINVGILIFAISFIVGSLAKQWWIFYSSSVVSALFVGASVMLDIKEVHSCYEKLIPFIKQDIVHNFAFKDFSKTKIAEMLRILGKKTGMDTFVVIRITDDRDDVSADLEKIETAMNIVNRHISALFDESEYILIPISNDRIGIILSLLKDQPGKRYNLLEALESAHAEILTRANCTVKIGIGRSYGNIEDLRLSYFEALNAQEYAEQRPGTNVIHVENMIGTIIRGSAYPVHEKEKLLSAVKTGDIAESKKTLKAFLERFRVYVEERPGILKVRLYELSGSLIDSAILGGGDEKKLNDLVAKYFNDINLIKEINVAQQWLSDIVVEIAGNVGGVYESRSRSLIESAKKYIENNFQSQLSYKDVAREIFISPSYFLTLFKKETNQTFTDYLTAIRINEAKRLLRTSGLNITEIAYEIGFNNSNYFSNIFKKTVGISAMEYKKKF